MTAVPDEGASQLKQAQVIGGLLAPDIVAHQYPPALGALLAQPTKGAFHHPPSGGKGFLAPWKVQLLLPNAPDMRTVPEGSNGPVAGGIVIPSRHRFWVPSGPATTMLHIQGRPQEFRCPWDVGLLVPPPRQAGGPHRQLRPVPAIPFPDHTG